MLIQLLYIARAIVYFGALDAIACSLFAASFIHKKDSIKYLLYSILAIGILFVGAVNSISIIIPLIHTVKINSELYTNIENTLVLIAMFVLIFRMRKEMERLKLNPMQYKQQHMKRFGIYIGVLFLTYGVELLTHLL